jgi:acyl-CoA thioester hydrolase
MHHNTKIMKSEDILSYQFFHAIPVQTRYNDIDLAGHVNNAVYYEYYDLGRVNYFNDVLGEHAFSEKKHVAIAQSNTTFLKELFLFDDIQLVSKTIRFGTKSFDLLQAILLPSEEGMELCSFTITTFVCMNYTKHESIKIPHEWKEKIELFEQQ